MFVITVALDLVGAFVPLVRANQVALFAFVFLWLPQRLVPPDGPEPDAFGLTLRNAKRGIGVGLGWALVLFVLFVPSFHVWNVHALGQSFHWEPGAYARPDDRYFGEPMRVEPGVVAVYHRYDVVAVHWTPDEGPWEIVIESDGELWTIAHEPLTTASGIACAESSCRASGNAPRVFRAQFRATDASYVRVAASADGRPLDIVDYKMGLGARAPDGFETEPGVELRFGYGWILMSLLMQLLLIALPEEFFYRGYLQRRLDQCQGRKEWKVGPLPITRSNLVVSMLFALGHFVIGFAPARLVVFFPSLLFGILRDRTDGIAAPIVFHAACNLMVQVAAVHYWA